MLAADSHGPWLKHSLRGYGYSSGYTTLQVILEDLILICPSLQTEVILYICRSKHDSHSFRDVLVGTVSEIVVCGLGWYGSDGGCYSATLLIGLFRVPLKSGPLLIVQLANVDRHMG